MYCSFPIRFSYFFQSSWLLPIILLFEFLVFLFSFLTWIGTVTRKEKKKEPIIRPRWHPVKSRVSVIKADLPSHYPYFRTIGLNFLTEPDHILSFSFPPPKKVWPINLIEPVSLLSLTSTAFQNHRLARLFFTPQKPIIFNHHLSYLLLLLVPVTLFGGGDSATIYCPHSFLGCCQ